MVGWAGSGCAASHNLAYSQFADARKFTFTTNAAGTPATGAPTISGSPQVGATLTANQGTIADADGLPSGSFPTGYSFQWIRGSSNISGATSRTYKIADTDLAQTISVRVSFTDGAGNAEARTSAPTAAVTNVFSLASLPLTGHTVTFKALFTSASRTVSAGRIAIYGPSDGSLDAGSFAINGNTLTHIFYQTNGHFSLDGPAAINFDDYFGATGGAVGQSFTLLEEGGTAVTVPLSSLTVTDSRDAFAVFTVTTALGTAFRNLASGDKFIFALSTPPATPVAATGQPTITGGEHFGGTLTAGIGTIADANGLPSAGFPAGYTFQWLNNGTPIRGATSQTYTLRVTDVGDLISVRVSFTDGAGAAESRTSATTGRISSNSPASGQPEITGAAQVGQTLTAGFGTIADTNGLPSGSFPTGYTFQWLRGGTTISGATAQTYTLVDADIGSGISVTVSFRDGAGNDESLTSAATAAVAAPTYDIPLPEVLYSGYDSLYVISTPDSSPLTAHCAGVQVGSVTGTGHLGLSTEWVKGCHLQFKGRIFLPVLAADTQVGEPVVSEQVRFGFILAQWRGPFRDLADYIPPGIDHSFMAMFLVLLGGMVAAGVVAGTIRKAGPVAIASAVGALCMVALTPAPIVLWLLIPAMTAGYLLLIRGGWQ